MIDELLAENALFRLRAAQGVLGLADKHDPGPARGRLREGHRGRRPVLPHHQGHPRRRHRSRGHDPQYVELPRYHRASVATLLEGMVPGPATTDRGGCRRDFFVDSAGEEVDATRVGVLAWLWRNGLDIIMLAHAHGRMVTLIPIGLLSLLPVHAAGVSEDRHAGMFSAVRYAPERPHPQSLSRNRHRVRIRPSVVARRRCAGRTRTPAGSAPLPRGPRDDRDRGDLGGCQARATPRARLPLGCLPPPGRRPRRVAHRLPRRVRPPPRSTASARCVSPTPRSASSSSAPKFGTLRAGWRSSWRVSPS